MTLSDNEFKTCPICGAKLDWVSWDDFREALTYIRLTCNNCNDYTRQYATSSKYCMETLIAESEKHHNK